MNKEKALKNQGLEFREDIAVEGGKLVLLINTDKKSKKQTLQTKFYQNIFVIRCKIRTHPVLSPL